jgi:hypothetical protein
MARSPWGCAVSIELMTLVWKVPFPTSTQMVIALKLADHAKDDGSDIFPGRSSLASRARCSESTVKNTLRLFRETGILVVIEEGGKGPHDTTHYQMNVALLQAIADGQVTLSGSSTDLAVACGELGDENTEKGSIFDPLENYPVNQLPVRGQPIARKGSTHSPQTITNHQEPSNARTREDSKLVLGSEAVGKTPRALPVFQITPADTSWEHWMVWLRDQGRGDLAHDARQLGRITTSSRWPKDDSPLPRVGKQGGGLTERSKRMAGDAA